MNRSRLTKHFIIDEFTLSQTAVRRGIDNRPSTDELANLKQLALFLEIVREIVKKPIIITSGYRSPELNRWVGGSRTSAHLQGLAADIVTPSFGTPTELAELIAALDIEFDQVILEFGRWVHVSVSDNPRHQVLTAVSTPDGTKYEAGLVI